MKSINQVLQKIKGKKLLFLLLLLIPFISIILIITFRHTYAPTNEEIIEDVKNISAYTVNSEYCIKNSKGEYKEATSLFYRKNIGMRIEFDGNRVKIYKDGYINMLDNGDEYELNGGMDSLFPLGFYNNLLSNKIKDIKDGAEEWGDIKYLEVDIDLSGSNNHISSAKLYINKADKSPIVTKVYDDKGKEKVTIIYKEFKQVKEIDRDLF